jgi:molybdopterin-guanine dinucleotide biosynthesis protein A
MAAMSTPRTRPPHPREAITGLILAGGLGRRMGGEDKGLVVLAGRPMVEHVLEALRPQVGTVLINANRNLDRYAAFGVPVVTDTLEGFMGPLAGALSGLKRLATPFMLTVPCDAPLVAPDLAARLYLACVESDADVTVATDGRRQQPVFLLLRARVAPGLAQYLEAGGRKVDTWFGQLRLAEADLSDRPDAFLNVNDPDERTRIEARLLSTPGLR